MKLDLLRTETERHLAYWVPKMLSEHWTWGVTYLVEGKMAQFPGRGTAWMSCEALTGERKLRLEVNKSLKWEEGWYDLELSVVHELIHIVMQDSGFDRAVREMVSDIGEVSKDQGDMHHRVTFQAMEEYIDRIATIILGR